MTRSEKAGRIGRILDALYPVQPIPLDHDDPYTLLVAVMLSAQTTDKKVNEVTPALFDAAPGPQAMVELGQERVLEFIRQLGLAPTKSRNLVALSRKLLQYFGGAVPPSIEAMETLPGIGHKTASVVAAQAFGIPAFPVDTHIHRLSARWGLSSGRNVVITERDLKKVFPRDVWNVRHLQIIFFGREHCPALYHDLSGCPICAWAATKKRIGEETRAHAGRRKKR